MSHAVRLALTLDEEMLAAHGVVIADPWVPDKDLPPCPDLASQLGNRFLVKYVRREDRSRYSPPFSGITTYPGVHYVTPTAICRDELVAILNLPPLPAPRYALILDPARLDAVGPRRVRSGQALEYVLPNGFPSNAVVAPGWPVEVR